jgi:hypothetical protein
MRKVFSFSHLAKARLGDPMHFHSYSLEKGAMGFKLKLSEMWSTDTAGIAECLEMEAEPKIELEIILKLIESKISPTTLMTIIPPEPPSSLVAKAKEQD